MALSQYLNYDPSIPARTVLMIIAETYGIEVTALKHSAITKDEIAKIRTGETAAMRADPEYQELELKTPTLELLKAKYVMLIDRMVDITRASFRDIWVKAVIEKRYVDVHYETGAGAVHFYTMKPTSWQVRATGDLAGGVKRYDDHGYRTFSSFGFISIYLDEDTFEDEYVLRGADIDYYQLQKLADVVVFKNTKIELGDDIGGTNIDYPESRLPFDHPFGDGVWVIDTWEELYDLAMRYFHSMAESIWNPNYLNDAAYVSTPTEVVQSAFREVRFYWGRYIQTVEAFPWYALGHEVQSGYKNFLISTWKTRERIKEELVYYILHNYPDTAPALWNISRKPGIAMLVAFFVDDLEANRMYDDKYRIPALENNYDGVRHGLERFLAIAL